MQLTFGDAETLGQRKRTRREIFLAEMEQVVPWQALLALIEPHYPKLGRPGRQPYPLATMLRIHFLQQWYALSDPAMEEALYDTPVMRRFARLGGVDAIPDETTILHFRRLLETHGLAGRIFERVNAHLARKGLSLHAGTIVDATIIAAPSSTKNAEGKRDPEMCQTKKGNQWHFGMKAHIGVDDESGLVHHVECTAANVADVTRVHRLLHDPEHRRRRARGHPARHQPAGDTLLAAQVSTPGTASPPAQPVAPAPVVRVGGHAHMPRLQWCLTSRSGRSWPALQHRPRSGGRVAASRVGLARVAGRLDSAR